MDRGHGRFLLVEDDALLALSLVRGISAYGATTVAETVARAIDALTAQTGWSALLIDVGLPDGSGFDVLAAARTLCLTTPAVILTGSQETDSINRAFDLGAQYLVKPVSQRRIVSFIEQALAAPHPIGDAVDAWGRTFHLSEAERDILLRSALGASRRAIADVRATSVLTVKKQVATMLQKTGEDSLHTAVAVLLREVAGV